MVRQTDNDEFRLHSISVVVIAEHHNPSMLNKGFLINEGIVPPDWSDGKFVVTPEVAFVEYLNNYLSVDQDRLTFREIIDPPATLAESSKICDLASNYVSKQPSVTYKKLGLNYALSIIRDNPKQWLTKQFANPKFHDQNFHMQSIFVIPLADSTLNVTFHDGVVPRNGKNENNGIRIGCNVHYDGPFESVDVLRQKITERTYVLEQIKHYLDNFVGA